jgi:hypothetical protein
MYTAIPHALVAALASASPPEVADVEVASSTASSTLTAYDADGEVVGEVATWSDADQVHLDVLLPDGSFMGTVSDGQTTEVESDGMPEIVEFMVALETALPKLTDDESLKCLGALLLMAGGCGAGPVSCAGGAIAVHFACIRGFDDEDEEDDDDESETESGS